MINKKFIFGMENVWLLAPTRHGAHNWEGPGELTSMAALESLGFLTKQASWLGKGADVDAAIFAGHSMGGHGAWQLSTHYPDKALAVISAAGWLSKEDYGESNLLYRHDISISHTDPVIKGIQEGCVAENQADKHSSNLKGIPVMIRIGANDRTVHPYFTRRIFRLLKENDVNVTYKEFKGKEHWWWDSEKENDGGVTNDEMIRNFVIDVVEQYEKKKKDCVAEGCKHNVGRSKYHKPVNSRGIGQFTYVLYNPASFKGGRGIQVLQQKIPFRKSEYQIFIDYVSIRILSTNIQKILVDEPKIEPVGWQEKDVIVDGQTVSKPERSLPWCFYLMDGKWEQCRTSAKLVESLQERGPQNIGPARRVAEKPFVIVICDNGNPAELNILQNSAVVLANLFHLTSDGRTSISVTKHFTSSDIQDKNVILVGTDKCVQGMGVKTLVTFTENSVRLGDCHFPGKNLSALYLLPFSSNSLMLLMTGHATDSIRTTLMKLSIPTIPPMARSPFSNLIPDYVILSPHVLSKGPGGFLCSGFWSNSWTYISSSSSCSC